MSWFDCRGSKTIHLPAVASRRAYYPRYFDEKYPTWQGIP